MIVHDERRPEAAGGRARGTRIGLPLPVPPLSPITSTLSPAVPTERTQTRLFRLFTAPTCVGTGADSEGAEVFWANEAKRGLFRLSEGLRPRL